MKTRFEYRLQSISHFIQTSLNMLMMIADTIDNTYDDIFRL